MKQTIFNNKKGNIFGFALMSLISSPLILIGLAIFIVLMMVMFYFMLGKIVGTALIIMGAWSFLKRTWAWYVSLILILIGIFMFINPMDIAMLSMIPRG